MSVPDVQALKAVGAPPGNRPETVRTLSASVGDAALPSASASGRAPTAHPTRQARHLSTRAARGPDAPAGLGNGVGSGRRPGPGFDLGTPPARTGRRAFLAAEGTGPR